MASDMSARAARSLASALLITFASAALALSAPASAIAAVQSSGSPAAAASSDNTNSLEAAASKAGETGRKVATSLIALAFAVAAIVLTFKRDFKEAVGVFAIGIVAVLLVSPAGLNVVRDTVARLFGSS